MDKYAREPIFNMPGATLALLAAMLALQAGRGLLTAETDFDLVARFAFTPARLTLLFDPAGVLAHVSQIEARSADEAEIARYFLAASQPVTALWTTLTYAFLHGDWVHFSFNAFWLAAFGSAVERRVGARRFLALGAVSAVAGALAMWVTDVFSFVPMIGASGAISGFMGAAARFIFEPGSALYGGEPSPWRSRGSITATLRNPRAFGFLAVWFVSNLIFGMAAQPLGMSQSPVAWEAHVGGFLAGFLLFSWFDRART